MTNITKERRKLINAHIAATPAKSVTRAWLTDLAWEVYTGRWDHAAERLRGAGVKLEGEVNHASKF